MESPYGENTSSWLRVMDVCLAFSSRTYSLDLQLYHSDFQMCTRALSGFSQVATRVIARENPCGI